MTQQKLPCSINGVCGLRVQDAGSEASIPCEAYLPIAIAVFAALTSIRRLQPCKIGSESFRVAQGLGLGVWRFHTH